MVLLLQFSYNLSNTSGVKKENVLTDNTGTFPLVLSAWLHPLSDDSAGRESRGLGPNFQTGFSLLEMNLQEKSETFQYERPAFDYEIR